MVEKEFFPKWSADLVDDADALGELLFDSNYHPRLFMLCFAIGVRFGGSHPGDFKRSGKGPRTGLSKSDLDLILAMQVLGGEQADSPGVAFAENCANSGLKWLLDKSADSSDRLSAVVEAVEGALPQEG